MSSANQDTDRQPPTTRPALEVLDRDQDRLLYEGDTRRTPEIQPLGGGFESFWMVLSWYQAAGIRTLGQVEKVLKPKDIMPESGVFEHLVLPLSNQDSAYVRRRLVEELDGACDEAYRQFRERANERVGSDEDRTFENIDVDEERNPLMRPVFKRMDLAQAGALTSLWDGFDDRESIGRWVRSLSSVCNGEKPEGMMNAIVSSPPLMEALLSKHSQSARLTRYRFAVNSVLPAFLAGARTLNGGEMSDTGGSNNWKQG